MCGCEPEHVETFMDLVRSVPHWQFELMLGAIETVVIDVVIGLLVWPRVRKHWLHHLERDKREGK